jgi:hypothetical protein
VTALLTAADATFLAAMVGLLAAILTALISAGMLGRKVHRIERTTASVEAEVTPNGGRSLKDQVTKLDERSAALETAFTGHDARLARVEAGIAALLHAAGIPPHQSDQLPTDPR